ncbi:cbb3-type cytochrome oxidase assembly protein CcoS [Bradymonas sediminis]|uniref:Cbb3-type cytochrome oxidase assembly protein CcoS n=1 Tax=Bradymonas sediminis TaxID=1548548 RepID=A0A2Z4FNZ2_9DELT|nr:cbb3-type cytochrome oxidase assembly protein CcoS [Bradymonas sediminis]AWV90673.1 cbb3-type cytochrome oxidase assembly protein CcoS [Bradymonas sediminis]TDP62689.1 cbb3-type cytochrome oxidase maturation protein [Bradymonas sediminis]
MNVIYFILPLALLLGAASVYGFIWATRKGQYDDLDTPPLRLLIDEEYVDKPAEKKRGEAE